MAGDIRFPKTTEQRGTAELDAEQALQQHEAPHDAGRESAQVEVRPDARLFERGGQELPGVDPLALGRDAIKGDMLKVLGKSIPRLDPEIRTPKKLENGLADLLGGIFANRGPLSDGKRIESFRSAAAAAAAVDKPKVAEGSPLGPLTIFRPGLGNTAPGPAQIARLAQYTDKLVIAYANPGTGAEARLHPVTEVDGVPLPPSVRGKVFAIGSPKNLMITFEQASDLFLEQLEAMKRSPHLGGIDLAHAKATVVAHSQGGLDSLLTRKRLEEAGLGEVFGKLATLATPFRGSPIANEDMFGLFTELGQKTFDLQSMGAINALDPDHVKKVIGADDQRRVDLSLVGWTGSGREGKSNLRRLFQISHGAIEVARSFVSLFNGADARDNDGLVTMASQEFGRTQQKLARSYDHAGIAEDPWVADQVVLGLRG